MADKKNYQETLLLPRTEFPMRAGLATSEPQTLARWEKMGLYQQQRARQKGKEKYILHDGPPYANGNIHIGHALNKILKDIVVRSQNMMGKDAPYVPGWDCHGLPIEWKVEENLRAQGKNKNDIPVNEFRKLCRDYASHWLNVQREEFKRLGVLGDWDKPYSTMDFKSEAIIAGEIGKVAMSEKLYQAYRPVMWSVPEQTALAEAEVEYKDVSSPAIFVGFHFASLQPNRPVGEQAIIDWYFPIPVEVPIWTTTPWTLPGNWLVAYNKDINYAVYQIKDKDGKDRRILLAEKLSQSVAEKCKWQSIKKEKHIDMNIVHKTSAYYLGNPLYWREGLPSGTTTIYAKASPLLHADFVTDDAGTGFVHIAPHHGMDDFNMTQHYKIDDFHKAQQKEQREIKIDEEFLQSCALKKDGYYVDKVVELIPELKGLSVIDEEGKDGGASVGVIKALARMGGLLGKENYKHPYPHSWRSKAPIIYMASAQWFVKMDSDSSLRRASLDALTDVKAYPANGKNALTEMISGRPDWCISRQRAWGVSLPLFVHKESGEVVRDKKLFARVEEVFAKDGADAWFDDAKYPNSFWLEGIISETDYNKYEKIKDVVDVWFDSGSTHAFVLAQREEFRNPGQSGEDVIADLYLEGTDQHRGWFHSSLLESVATRGRAPYKALLTHGFVLDEKGNKMSKSLGNVTAPEDVIRDHGADILRLWVVASNYTENLTIGKNILTQHSESYRRIRNTFRWLLGVLGSDPSAIPANADAMPSMQNNLERFILSRLAMLDNIIRAAAKQYDFNRIYRELYKFCDQDLSAFYFDVRKDSLYCDDKDFHKRKNIMVVINKLHECLCKWFAPILCFTAEEAWRAHPRHQGKEEETVHLHDFPNVPSSWADEEGDKKIQQLMVLRQSVLRVLETARKDKKIGSGLEAAITITLPKDMYDMVEEFDLADIFIVSDVTVKMGDELKIEWHKASGEKCERCWKILPTVATSPEKLCARCTSVVAA